MRNRLPALSSLLPANFNALFSIFALAVALLTFIRLPGSMQFDVFAFSDSGSNLTAQYLIDRGYRPTLDFGYLYGLLGLVLGRVWFTLTNRTPWSYEAAMCFSAIFIVWALARITTALKLGIPGLLLVLFTLPILVPAGYPTFAHALEAVLLYHALAAHVRGHRSAALTLTTVCIFAKPSIAYFYGLFLVVLIVLDLKREGRLRPLAFARALLPAAAALSLVAVALLAIYGLRPLAFTVFPVAGRSTYAANDFGFFTAGRAFWAPPGATLAYYLESAAGFWLAATAVLLIATLAVITSAIRSHKFTIIDEFILTCAALHLVFITILWGTQFSWIYYCWILIIGLAAATRLGRGWRWAIACLALFLPASRLARVAVLHLTSPASSGSPHIALNATERALSGVSQSEPTYRLWFSSSPSATTANLWASADERDEWAAVLKQGRGQRVAVLAYDGCADLLYPDLFMPPVALYLYRGSPTPGEVQRQLAQLRASTIVVTPSPSILRDWPQFGSLVAAQFRLLPGGRHFAVYQRITRAKNSSGG